MTRTTTLRLKLLRTGARAGSITRRLREEVAPVYDAVDADPGRVLATGQVEATLRAHHAARLKAGDRDA